MTFIQRLRLTDFRNYSALDLEFSGAPVVLFGANGAGKTNILEAISFLSPGRGLRRAKMEDIARRDGDVIAKAWGMNAHLNAEMESSKISIGQVPEYPKRRTIRIEDRAASGTELAGMLKMMWLTPAQDRLFTGPASDRRKFLDRLTLAHAPDHGQSVIRYEKARAERGRLLSDGITDAAWYDAIERDMAKAAAQIALSRHEVVERLADEIASRDDGEFPKANIALEGEIENFAASCPDLGRIEDVAVGLFASNRTADQRAGRTLRGVHKSDLIVSHAEKDMPAADCSTGEQKALLIGLILAQARAQAEHHPFLLLDEVAAHLDVDRRAALIEELLDLGTQVFMTGTDASLFEAFDGRAQTFRISEGRAESV